MCCLSKPLGGEFGLDLIGHDAGLVLEFLQAFVVLVVTGPAGLEEEILGLVPPRLQPVRPGRETPVEKFEKTFEGVGGG